MKQLSVSTPVITTFYAKENVFGFIAGRPETNSYMEDGQQIDETKYKIELADGSFISVENLHLAVVDPENMPDDYELSTCERMNKIEQTKKDNVMVSYRVAFTCTDDGRNEIKDYDGTNKEVRLAISNFASENGYNSYSTSTL